MNPSITQYPGTIPGKGQSQTDFDANVDDFLSWLADTHAPELQAFGDWSRDIIAAIVLDRLPDLAGRAGSLVRVKKDETGVELTDDVVKVIRAGQPLPTTDQGPIFHPDYNSIMTWRVFDQHGANYTGYASVEIGRPLYDGQVAQRPGYLRTNMLDVSASTYAALEGYVRHNNMMVPVANWGPAQWVFGDNGDGTFRLPDVRGEHVRIWDAARGVDTGRAFGSFSVDTVKDHDHFMLHYASAPYGYGSESFGRVIESVPSGALAAARTSGARNSSVATQNTVRDFALPFEVKF